MTHTDLKSRIAKEMDDTLELLNDAAHTAHTRVPRKLPPGWTNDVVNACQKVLDNPTVAQVDDPEMPPLMRIEGDDGEDENAPAG